MKKFKIILLTLSLGNTTINSSVISAQNSVNCDLTLKTTIQGFKVYKHNPSGTIMFRAKLAIDSDGSPRAYGPNNSGLDYTANAGSPGNWWGVVTNNSGNPVIQGSGSPYPGMYVSTTSLINTAYAATSPFRYVNSEAIPFFVLPTAVKTLGNIQLGDIGYVYNTLTGLGCYAIFADGGPAGKLGEASIYLANQIGVNSNARSGGTSQGIIDYIVFPGSGAGQGVHKTIGEINTIGAAKIATVGGTGITGCLNTNSCGMPSGLTVSLLAPTSATLNWTAVSGANSYTVKYKKTSLFTWTTISSTTTSKAISGLTASTSYQFQVQAVCSSAGAYSAAATFTTLASTSTSST
ncbi:MAG: fibronectin type III domain-containing protein, partial [Ferruginibacter sp.]|nr:fibronectin type III domain-containing protein [Ferruginibacter sp.]